MFWSAAKSIVTPDQGFSTPIQSDEKGSTIILMWRMDIMDVDVRLVVGHSIWPKGVSRVDFLT